MKTIAVVNQKGGCGKTTVSINLSSALADAGQKVLRFLTILSPAKAKGPALVDMATDEAWRARRPGKARRQTSRKPPRSPRA